MPGGSQGLKSKHKTTFLSLFLVMKLLMTLETVQNDPSNHYHFKRAAGEKSNKFLQFNNKVYFKILTIIKQID